MNKQVETEGGTIKDDRLSSNKTDTTKKMEEKNPDHTRRVHRLQTARVTIWGGGVIIFILIIFQILVPVKAELSKEVIRDGIVAISTIVTLALGFIAGSNIE